MEHTGEMIYLETGSYDPAYNLAFEEFVLKKEDHRNYLMLWQNDNTIVVGQNQNTQAEINSDYVRQNNIHVVRRTTGGGAVYHDLGNINYSFITDVEDAARMSFEYFTRPVVEALKTLGLNAEASGRNDILIDGKKVSGTAQRLYQKRMLFHGTLLFDSDMEKVAGALNADPIKFQSKSTRSVRARVGNIRSFLKEDMSIEEFKRYIRNALGGNSVVSEKLTKNEFDEVLKLKKSRYDTWEWTYGRSPEFTVRNKKKWDGGILEAGTRVEDGIITDIRFYGDFLSLKPLDDVTEALTGCRYMKDDVLLRLESMELKDFFGSISAEEIADTIFA